MKHLTGLLCYDCCAHTGFVIGEYTLSQTHTGFSVWPGQLTGSLVWTTISTLTAPDCFAFHIVVTSAHC